MRLGDDNVRLGDDNVRREMLNVKGEVQAPAEPHRRDACCSGTGMVRLLQPIMERQASRLLKPTGLFFPYVILEA